jgi:dephospho-CoA kinase
MKLIALVGMAGSGKSEVSRVFEQDGFARIRFGDITDEEVAKRGLPLTADNERTVRESLRRTLGMEAYAILNRPKIDAALEISNVIIDGLYSWEEYVYLKSCYGEKLTVIAVYASPRTRYNRLKSRSVRPFTPAEAADRDKTEIENINKGGPIAMADYTLANESSPEALRKETAELLKAIKYVPD